MDSRYSSNVAGSFSYMQFMTFAALSSISVALSTSFLNAAETSLFTMLTLHSGRPSSWDFVLIAFRYPDIAR